MKGWVDSWLTEQDLQERCHRRQLPLPRMPCRALRMQALPCNSGYIVLPTANSSLAMPSPRAWMLTSQVGWGRMLPLEEGVSGWLHLGQVVRPSPPNRCALYT